MQKWDSVFLADNNNDFEDTWNTLIEFCQSLDQDLSDYFFHNVYKKKEKLFPIFINDHMHFGCTTNNFCEGQHSALKNILDQRKGNLYEVFIGVQKLVKLKVIYIYYYLIFHITF